MACEFIYQRNMGTKKRASRTGKPKKTDQLKVQNYFNYFTEIEEHFQRRRGSLLMLSTLDWALIESWREAVRAAAAVLRGIDAAFDKYDARKAKPASGASTVSPGAPRR
jgi:hypothetical protein